MTFTIFAVCSILLFHYIGDFLLQTEDQSQKKSRSVAYLFEHVATYSFIWVVYIGTIFLTQCVLSDPLVIAPIDIAWFGCITFLAHFVTDFFTSKLNRYLLSKGKPIEVYMPFFRGVGFDQLLHYTQLFLTWNYFIGL
jgi:hypothetical protein